MCAVVACLLARVVAGGGIARVPMAGEERHRRRGAVSGHRVLPLLRLASHARARALQRVVLICGFGGTRGLECHCACGVERRVSPGLSLGATSIAAR
ncbi:hypothetical protein HPB50_022205 [Hyalomma asiaticum]|uniref:Uncharacterized protein n=1 Tax=Hyalomma asiaticum TaxID=266040 RepID=A0ACB7S8Y8_HYAAI|nr:hypothetical protein HPB50_022205 [Hyalomma asiaticum]